MRVQQAAGQEGGVWLTWRPGGAGCRPGSRTPRPTRPSARRAGRPGTRRRFLGGQEWCGVAQAARSGAGARPKGRAVLASPVSTLRTAADPLPPCKSTKQKTCLQQECRHLGVPAQRRQVQRRPALCSSTQSGHGVAGEQQSKPFLPQLRVQTRGVSTAPSAPPLPTLHSLAAPAAPSGALPKRPHPVPGWPHLNCACTTMTATLKASSSAHRASPGPPRRLGSTGSAPPRRAPWRRQSAAGTAPSCPCSPAQPPAPPGPLPAGREEASACCGSGSGRNEAGDRE